MGFAAINISDLILFLQLQLLIGLCSSCAPSGKLKGRGWGGRPPLPGSFWNRLLFSTPFPTRPPPPPLLPPSCSSSGAGVVAGTSQSSVGGETQRFRCLSNTNMAGQRWRRGYPPWQAQYRLQDLPRGTFPLGSSLQRAATTKYKIQNASVGSAK